MSAGQNKVFEVAMQLGRGKDVFPENVIFGYSKLLSLEENQVSIFVPAECMDDLETAREWFSDNKLDYDLIKSGLLLLLPYIPKDTIREKEDKFEEYLKGTTPDTASSEILGKAKELSFIPMDDYFSEGKELSDVYKYMGELRDRMPRDEEAENPAKTKKTDTVKTEESDKAGKYNTESVADNKEPSPEKKEQTQKDKASSRKSDEPRSLADLSKKYRELSIALLDVVKGQDQAVLKFIQGYNQGELLRKTKEGDQPKSFFFFFGPPGVGKTLLAETAGEALGIPYKIFNMSEYVTSQAIQELIGSPGNFSSVSENNIAGFVSKNPECLLVFDEIEKAHPIVLRQFLQILGSGKVNGTIGKRYVSFRDVTIIFTSNVGRELYSDRSVNLTTLPEKVVVDAITSEKGPDGDPALSPEFCSRIASGNIILFNHLSVKYLVELVKDNFDQIVRGMEEEYGVKVKYSNYLPLLFIYNRGGDIDARVAVGQSGKFLKDEIYELLRQMENSKSGNEAIKSINIDVEWDGIDPELKELFKSEEKSEVLFFSDDEMFDALENSRYTVHRTADFEKAVECLKNDISAVYIDPFLGKNKEDDTILSIADYNTKGVKLLHNIVESQAGLPIYLLEMGGKFSEVDRNTFIQEGAAGIATVDKNRGAGFKRLFTQIMEELYMEKESRDFTQRGWVIDFSTKQEINEGKAVIRYYDLKKRMAVDVESRGSILSDAQRPNVRFSDIIGAEKAKEELQYFVKYLKNPKQFLAAGGKAPKGVLLYGPPGTGKTMLAKAMAGECDVHFMETSAANFKNKYVGESEANIRKLFKRARKFAPAIIFIDEIDAIGKQRTGSEFTAVTDSMLNVLLTEMDGFSSADSSKPVFVLAATNYGVGAESDGISSLDSALIRRFDNKIYVDLPNEEERKTYILRLLENKNIDGVSDEIAKSVAERTTGQSLAILQNVIDLAFRNANREGRAVCDKDILNALEEYNYGEKKEHTPDYYRKVAYHETGHAYVSYLSGDKPSYITIESRGNFGGYMQHANAEDVPEYTREQLIGKIRT
ncbi:MAG: AAA family ATPase, partial [Butyrivibrio sp.]|nr:AAA family ATPase [Butyrivibrio sp.]